MIRTLTIRMQSETMEFRGLTSKGKAFLSVADPGFPRRGRQPVITGRNEVVAKVMFLHVSVILSTGGVSPGTTTTPPGPSRPPLDQADTPQTRQTPPRDQADLPWTKQTHPPPGLGRPTSPQPPWDRAEPPPPEEDCSIRSMSGRYASYWNAFLFGQIFSSELYENKRFETKRGHASLAPPLGSGNI